MYKISTSQLKETCSLLNKANKPLMFFGTYGIGKSEMIFQWAKEQAVKEHREFVDWVRASEEEQKKALESPEKYYAFVDIRISQLDAGDLRGIPIIANTTKDYLQLVTLKWINYITQPLASGCVFFDEINLAMPSIVASAYAIINDKVISDRAISKKIFICAAGNTIEDTDMVQPMSKPLLDRFAVAELVLDKKYWLSEYAVKHINPYLYAFCDWDKDYIHKKSKTDGIKDVTPRGISNASLLLNNVDFNNSEEVYRAIALCVGEDFASRFKAYYNHVIALDWDKLYKDPTQIESMNIDLLYATMGGLVASLKECSQSSKSVNEFIMNSYDMLNLICYFPSEYVMAMFRQCQKYTLFCNKDKQLNPNLLQIFYKICILGKLSLDDDKSKKKAEDKIKAIFKLFSKRHYSLFEELSKYIGK